MVPNVIQRFKVKCQRSRSQNKNVASSPNYKLFSFQEVRVVDSSGDVRILIESCDTAVCAHAQYKIFHKTVENDWCDIGRLQAAIHSQLPHIFLLNSCLSQFLLQLEAATW